jgi:hypothetical protein
MKRYILALMSLTIFISCKQKNEDSKYFNGEIIMVNTNVVPDTLRGEKIALDGLYTGNMWAYDTLIGFLYHEFPDYKMRVFNVNTGKFLYPLCKRGMGPAEFPSITYTSQIVYEEQLYYWIRKESGRNECVLVNLETPGDIVKRKMDINIETDFEYTFAFVFILNDSLFMASNQGEILRNGNDSFRPPAYCIYNSRTKEAIKSYNPYNGFIPVSNEFFSGWWYGECYGSMDRIKPDKSKMAMGMRAVDQINIIDIATGNITGYRSIGTPDFEYLRHDPNNYKAYYVYLCVDDKYIYGIRSVTGKLRGEEARNLNTINVFDWDGNFIRKIVLDKTAIKITLDPVNKYLYTDVSEADKDEEEIYRYDVSYLYK